MIYFLVNTYLAYNFILIAAAIIPAVILMVKVYKSDRLDRESPKLLWSLVTGGILSALLALVEEKILCIFLNAAFEPNTEIYNIVLYFVVVAVSEESSKYLLMKKRTWNNPEFNCQFDGVVYAVFTSLGFALWENISYVLNYGFGTALVRAVTAIPGHACFGVFMGIFYGIARKYENAGAKGISKAFRIFAIVMPAFIHGAYDFIASSGSDFGGLIFVAFIFAMFIITYILVNKMSKEDVFINE